MNGQPLTDEQRAAGTIRRTGKRLHASKADVDHVLAALFSTVLSTGTPASKQPPSAPRTRLTPDQKLQIRTLLAEGRSQQDVADELGLTRSTIAYVKGLPR